MTAKESRKESIRRFKEAKPSAGAYAVRCVGIGRIWVGFSLNLSAMKNSIWFQLRGGSHREKELQAEWSTRGETAFEYEVLEVIDVGTHPIELPELLKAAKARWVAQLGASPLL